MSFLDKDGIYFITIIASLGGAWFLVKYQVGELIKTQKAMFKKIDEMSEKVILTEKEVHSLQRDAQEFAKQKEKITILEQNSAHHIDLISAETKFVTRREFELVIENFNKDIKDLKNGQDKIFSYIKQVVENK